MQIAELTPNEIRKYLNRRN